MSTLLSLQFWAFVGVVAGIYTILALGLQVQFGFTGLLNFGHAAFMAVGAYSAGIFTAPVAAFTNSGLILADEGAATERAENGFRTVIAGGTFPALIFARVVDAWESVQAAHQAGREVEEDGEVLLDRPLDDHGVACHLSAR